jgi:thiol-disulfide isomerase/thioredoxin
MIARVLPFALLLAAQTTAQPPPKPVPTPAPVVRQAAARPPIYSADVKARMERVLELADMDDIRVLINWGTNECEPCKKFDQATRADEALRRFSNEYHVVNVDVGNLDKNLDLAQKYGVTLKPDQLPMLTVLDQHGKVLVHASRPDFLAAGKPDEFDPAKVAAFFTLHQAATPDAVAPFEAAVKQAKTEGKLVFVWFSAPW